MRRGLIVGVIACFTACARDGAVPTAPGAAPTVAPFGLTGTVTDTASRALAGARVEAMDGPQRGAAAVTDAAGTFAFGPIFTAAFTLRATRDGYRPASISIAGPQSARFFRLESVNGSMDLRGAYELTFEADLACTNLPASVRGRTYSATLVPAGASFYLGTLHGGDFAPSSGSYPSWDVLYVNVSEDFVRVFFGDPPIWEFLGAGSYLVISGDAGGTIGGSGSRWTFSGTFEYCSEREPDDYPECEMPPVTCRSSNHHLTLTRR